jgi:hypothetical protein
MMAAAITIPVRDFRLLNSCVSSEARRASSTVVGAVGLCEVSSVGVAAPACGRMRVSVSPATGGEPNFSVPALSLTAPDSRTSGVPSMRQKVSAASASTRLHWGQRFIEATA